MCISTLNTFCSSLSGFSIASIGRVLLSSILVRDNYLNEAFHSEQLVIPSSVQLVSFHSVLLPSLPFRPCFPLSPSLTHSLSSSLPNSLSLPPCLPFLPLFDPLIHFTSASSPPLPSSLLMRIPITKWLYPLGHSISANCFDFSFHRQSRTKTGRNHGRKSQHIVLRLALRCV